MSKVCFVNFLYKNVNPCYFGESDRLMVFKTTQYLELAFYHDFLQRSFCKWSALFKGFETLSSQHMYIFEPGMHIAHASKTEK